jgi:hypothetical protein
MIGKWEHKADTSKHLAHDQIQAFLDQRSKEGWELVSAIYVSDYDRWDFFWKRPAQP